MDFLLPRTKIVVVQDIVLSRVGVIMLLSDAIFSDELD